MNRRRALATMALLACSMAHAVMPAEYLVTVAPGGNEKTVRDVYARFGIKSVKALGNDVYLVIVQHDPGLAAMAKAQDERIKAVQPNQRYRRY